MAAVLSLLFIAGLFWLGGEAAAGASAGLSLCGRVVVPSLFPFMIAALFISKSGLAEWMGRPLGPAVSRLFKLPAAAAGPLLLSFIAGYPVGARLTRGLYEAGRINEKQANTLLCFTVNAGPAFIVTAAGMGMLHSSAAGWLLLAAHVLAALLVGLLAGRWDGRRAAPRNEPRNRRGAQTREPSGQPKGAARPGLAAAFVEAVSDASLSMLQICGWVTLFSVILAMLLHSGLPAPLVTLLGGLAEVTTGAAAVAPAGNLPLLAALLGWAGLSVQFQSLSSLGSLRPRYGRFFAARALHGLLSALLVRLLLTVFPIVLPASADLPLRPAASGLSFAATLGFLLLLVVFLCFAGKGRVESSEVRLWARPR
ncbi:MAG: hypothetical protein HFE86_05655 [Clostridiales bacterium]|nr:hypothetical protein [Clostridiales bacterium]